MNEQTSKNSSSEGKLKPGDNPNKLKAKRRMNVRPKTQNSSNPAPRNMVLNWIDPLPEINAIHALGMEPNPEVLPAGEIDLDFALPTTIARPFMSLIESVGDRISLDAEEKETAANKLEQLSYFKSARQLYSTMTDTEKSINQPLKSVYYDETPIPLHLAGGIGIIGHMDTKLGPVHVKEAGLLYKRWIAKGLSMDYEDSVDPATLVWPEKDSYNYVQRCAKEKVSELVKETYTLEVDGVNHVVSMPQLLDQPLETYYQQITNSVPRAEELRLCVSALQMTYRQYISEENIPHGVSRDDIIENIGSTMAIGAYTISEMREGFEEFISNYFTDWKWRIESIFTTGPPPAGSHGYGAQTVMAGTANTAHWQMPLSDADTSLGFLFAPATSFTLQPRLVGYSKRNRQTALAAYAAQDGKKIVD